MTSGGLPRLHPKKGGPREDATKVCDEEKQKALRSFYSNSPTCWLMK